MRISDWSSDVCSSDLPGHAPRSEIAMRAERAYRDAGGGVEEFGDSIGDADLVVDALFGIGLARAPDAEAAALVAAINDASAPVLALDVPSRVDADTGNVPGADAHAPRTPIGRAYGRDREGQPV